MSRKWAALLLSFVVEVAVVLPFVTHGPWHMDGLLALLLFSAVCGFNGGYLFPLIHRKYS